MKRYEDLVVVLFLAAAECSCSEYRYCPESCKKALGLESGIVGNDQLTAFSAYQNDFTTFGAHRARLNLKDWPPGYRASPVESSKLPWLRVDLRKDLVITGIATQGYGNASVAEWVTSYRLMFAKGAEFRNFVDVNGDVLNFVGNQDSDTIRLNEIRVPVVASSVILVPSAWHNNIGLRMELYGCEPGTKDGFGLAEYYFVAWLMLDQIPFSLNYLNKTTVEYTSSALQATNEVHSYLNSVAGYLFSKLLRFSPQQSPEISTFVTAEIAIYCTEESVHELIAKLKALISTESTAFASSYLKIQFPLACDCRPPTIDLQLKDHLPEADVVSTLDNSYFLSTRVTSNCSTPTQSIFKWMISKIDQETGYFSPFLRHGPPNRNVIKLHPRTLGSGYFYISVEAWVPDVQGTTVYDFGFLQIRRPPLVAKVVGPTVVSRGIGNITLDGSQSYDPTTKRFPYRGLQFTWSCHRKCLRHLIYSSLLSESEVEGCFGPSSQIGEIFSTQRSISLNADRMESNCTYTFQFSVAKFDRISWMTHVLLVKPAVPFYIRCITNCKMKVSSKRLLSLQLFCVYTPCLSNVTFKWTIQVHAIKDGVNEWIELKNISNKVQVSRTGLQIPRVDALITVKEGMMFRTNVKAFIRKDLEEQVFYTFPVNVPPIKEAEEIGCKVDPKEGSAILTDFHISCLGWYDKDTPLRYAFKYTFSNSTIIIQDGTVGNVTTKLPLGDPSKGYQRVLQLQIIDALGEFSTVLVTIKVRPPLASEALLDLIRAAGDEMKLLVQASDVDKAADMAITVLSVVDDNESLEQVETVKDSVLDVMAGVKIDRLNLVTKVGVIVAYSTKRVNQSISQDSQEDSLRLLQKMTYLMKTVHTNKTKELNVANDINVNLLTGIGNVIASSARDSSVEAVQIGAKINKEKSKNITKSALALLKVFKDEVVSRKGACSQPTVITTMYINLSACVERAFDIKAHKLLNGESAVMLPNARDLFPGQQLDDNTLIDIKLVSFKENPYTWHNSSRIIESSVLEIDLRNFTSGQPLRVSGLTKPIEMLIKSEREGLEQTLKNVKPQREFYVKPSSPHSIKNMRYHRISLPHKDVEVKIQIVPSTNVKLEVYIRYGIRPTPAQSNFQTVVPNTTTCFNNTKRDGFHNCLSDPYAFTISPSVTGKIGLHFLGIRYVVKHPERVNKRRRRRSKRSCLDNGGRQKRSCVEVKNPPSIHAATLDFKNGSDVKYTLLVTMGACMYWSEESEEWSSQGCKVGSHATPGKLQCMCTHLTSFGGDLLVAPNPIDFDKVWVEFGQLGKTGNFVVLTFICVVFGLYFIGLVLARTVDRRDICEVTPNVHITTETDCTHIYEISIQTGIWRGCGTTASVAIILFGENGSTPPIPLSQKHLQQRFFARGSVNTFTIHLAESLGSLFKIQIWHDNSGTSPAWFFHQVLITEPETQEKWYFLGNRWLALEKGNGKISAEIKAAGNEEYLAFRNLFHFRGAKTLGEKHLWLSLFTKAPHSTFTRCQRLSCCLSILMATMVTNAMFYKQGLEPEDTFKVGPIELSWTQIKIGLQSGLVAIPVNALVVAIFRNIKPAVLLRSEDNLLQSDEDSNRTCYCPYFCVYIGWVLCIVTSLVSAAFVVFYSLMWGKEVANQWLASVMISFFQDVIVIQPVKVALLVSLLSLIIKKPIENDEVHGQAQSNQTFDTKGTSYPPKDEELHRIRKARMMRTRLVKFLIEITVFVLFIVLLMIVCYGNRKRTRYELTDAVRKLFARFDEVNRTDTFWRWTKEFLVPGLFEVKWYNGRPFSYKEGFIANHEAFILGMPRLRQQRIKPDSSCQIIDHEPQLANKFSRCIPHFSPGSEDKTKYHMPGWIPIYNLTVFKSHFEKLFLCPRPWRYETAKELQTLSFQGLISVYSGGGFVADLGYNTDDALQVIYSLEENGWIDNATAAVFIEFIIYEPTSSLFSSVKFVFERLANGDTNATTRIKTLTIYSPQDPSLRGFYETCQLLFMLLVLFCVACELVSLYQRGCAFFKDPWSWMEILLLSSSMLSVATFFLKEAYTSKFIAKVKKNPFQSWSVDEIELWSDLEVTLLSFVVFLVTMKLLRIIRFNPQIIQMRLTLRIVARHFPSFTMVFFTVIIAYVQFTTLTFGRSVYEYRSFVRSISSILLMLVGAKAPFHKLQAVSVVLGPFFVFAYMISIVMILLNMFLAILNDSYRESRRVGIEGLEDLEFSRLLKQKANQVAHEVRVIVIKLIQAFPRLLRQGRPRKTMTFEGETDVAFLCESKEENSENNEDSAFTDDGESSLNDVIRLLADIKEDLRPSIMSLDDIVPIVTIDDTDKRWCESAESLEGWKQYSCSSLFSNQSGDAISKTDYLINLRKDERAPIGDFLVAESWNWRNPLQTEKII